MATSPSDPHWAEIPPEVPPNEVIAIAVALAATMSELRADGAAPAAPDAGHGHSPWRWEGWDQEQTLG